MRSARKLSLTIAWLCASAALALNAGLPPPPESVDRSTPLSTVQGFLRAAHAEQYEIAAHYLYLNHIPMAEQLREGARLARRLRFVIDRKLFLDYSKISDDPEGNAGSHPKRVQLGTLPLQNASQPIRLVRIEDAPNQLVWVFDEETVKAIDRLYESYGPPFGETVPQFLFNHSVLELELWQWLGVLVVLLFATVVSSLLQRIILAVARRVGRLKNLRWYNALLESARGPLRLPIWAGMVSAGTDPLLLTPGAERFFDIVVRSVSILAVAWFLRRFVGRSASYVQELAALESEDLGKTRGLRTQLSVLNRVLGVAIYVVSAALLLMQFEFVRNVGVSLLASAGIAGLVIGLAAQRSMSTLLAGIQLSITQPVRIGDTVVVESENGEVEEITLTYVVVRIWDKRRLIVPITYFLDKPFQNWSKGSTEILGIVTLQVDHLADFDAFREELRRVLEGEGRQLWDGKIQNLKVIEASDKTVTLRILISARDPDASWNLRCLVRERMLRLLREHPEWLPKTRTESRVGEPDPKQARSPQPKA
ncbi:MAG TPA: mechanosensitive ion channel family protein [Myxococcaceae bacterium]|nr:mechanosensitive ion channel family protein [Myxococcaceae bacterium]